MSLGPAPLDGDGHIRGVPREVQASVGGVGVADFSAVGGGVTFCVDVGVGLLGTAGKERRAVFLKVRCCCVEGGAVVFGEGVEGGCEC